MKPVKGALKIAKWILRLSLLLFLYFEYKEFILKWDFNNIEYITILGISVFSILLFFGGFLKKSSLSVISGLLLLLFGIVKIIIAVEIEPEMFFFIAIGFYFFTSGNYNYFRK